MVKLNRIYTKTGDDGTTGLVDGSRRPKHDLRIAAYGTVDEANSAIGLARLYTTGADDAMLARIQNDLFDLGADLATPGEDFTPGEMTLRVVGAQVTRLEGEIDAMNDVVGPLKSFVLPGGTPAAAALHLARTVTRRAERLSIEAATHEPINPLAIHYLNRLSDHLFVLSRLCNSRATGDVLWVPGAHR
jgi:cob(I)alamin adenosyltransferase